MNQTYMLTNAFQYFVPTKNLGEYIWELVLRMLDQGENSILHQVEFVNFGAL